MIRIESSDHQILAVALNRGLNNISRIQNLLTLHENERNDDLLRLSIIYLHSTLEDLMRNLIYYRILISDKQVISNLPLLNSNGRKEKFTFSDIQEFKKLTIQQLIEKSTLEYINRLTFNNSNDIIHWFEKFSIDKTKLTGHIKELDELLIRRHHIVHNSDLLADRVILNSNNETIHTGIHENIDEISREFVIKKMNLISIFIFDTTKCFLPKDVKITMQNV